MTRSVKEWIGKDDDAPVPPRVRLRVFAAKGGKCHRCGRKINGATEKWTCEHVKAIVNGGANRESVLDLTCSNCLQPKNAEDVAEKSAVAKTAKKHLGIKPKKKPWPKRVNPWGKRCADCGTNWPDSDNGLCAGCEAYREHTGAM